MNFALLGDDPAVMSLIGAIAADSGHSLSHAALTTKILPDVLQSVPAVRVVPQWEELLAVEEVDAVIIAGHQEPILEGAKKLAAAGKSLLLFLDAGQGLTFIYELTLIRDDAHVVLFPAFPWRLDPQVDRMRRLIEGGGLGRLLHLQLERDLHKKSTSAAIPLVSAAEIEQALLPDVDLLRFLVGRYNQVTALYSGTTGGSISLASLTLAADQLPEARWSFKANPSEWRWQLKVTGENGQARLSARENDDEVRLEIEGGDLPDDFGAGENQTGPALLEQFLATSAGQSHHADWSDLTHAAEIIEAAQRSVTRRRTIDVHFESVSERSLFKTQMTTLGCGLLVATLFGVMLLLVVGTFGVPRSVMHGLRVLVFLPLFVFLLLQLLVLITRPSSGKARTEEPRGSDAE